MKTRHILFLLLGLVIFLIPADAQDIQVKSFRLLEFDMTANVQGSMKKDQNGNTAALIKVVTSETGFGFENGLIGIVDIVYKTGEIWVYTPPRTRKLTIKHPRLGVLREYQLPLNIEAGRTYEMVLATGRVHTVIQEDAGGQYLIMTVSPSNAEVTIDGQSVEIVDGVVSGIYTYGSHQYKISAPLHQVEIGRFEIGNERKEVAVNLKPAYGVLNVTSSPAGAEVYIDDDYKAAGTTPFTTEWLSEGTHTLRFRLAAYKPQNVIVEVVGDGQTRPFNIDLQANFGEIIVEAPLAADIYINNDFKGSGRWSGRLNAGIYTIEARKASHYNSSQRIEINAGETQTITLPAPVPRYGTLNINTRPIGATVAIDGTPLSGTTPNIYKNILIGEHTLTVSKEDCTPIEQHITVEEGKILSVDLTLEAGNAEMWYKKGDEAYKAKNYTEALTWYRKAAERGYAQAQRDIGYMYRYGHGVSQDYSEAVNWYRKAAEQGYATAQNDLGIMYDMGYGVTENDVEAVKWYRKAAEQGNFYAQNNLGNMYQNGTGITRDYVEALKWFRKSANQGYANAQCELGYMYDMGQGVTENNVEAVNWYRKAAEQGYTLGEYNLGVMYNNGTGVTKDPYEAVKWYRKAAEKGYASAQNNLGIMYKNGTGVTKDFYEAVNWYRKAAEQGHAKAQYNLGYMYENGTGVTKNLSEALKWYNKAAAQNQENAKKALQRLGTSSQSQSSEQTSSSGRRFTVNGVSFVMKPVDGGTFRMGSNSEYREKPVHNVTLSSYYIGETEVTEALWKAVMGTCPSTNGNNYPVEKVSWNECQTFIRKLNSITGQNFRLPTEAEWEFAARGGNKSRGYTYAGGNNLGEVAWYKNNSSGDAQPVKRKRPNELGLYDMSGNIREWCSDWYDSSYYNYSSSTDPQGPSSGERKVCRGAYYYSDNIDWFKVSYRTSDEPDDNGYFHGLRLALSR